MWIDVIKVAYPARRKYDLAQHYYFLHNNFLSSYGY